MGKYTYASKIGPITIFEANNLITRVFYGYDNSSSDVITPLIERTITQFNEYFNNRRKSFDLPYELTGSDFNRRILTTMKTIPYGEKWPYAKLAKEAGFEGASRACGTVCRKNLLQIIIPCHRVIKSDNTLGSYNGGESKKEYLLNLESYL